MAPSVDGRIVTARWDSPSTLTAVYERLGETLDAAAWLIGRVSMEPYAGNARVPRRKTMRRIPRTDFIADSDAESYAIAIDSSGKLKWQSNEIDGAHVITILSEGVSDDYLAFLQSKGVSYLFGGRKDIDLQKVLIKLRTKFGIRKLLLEGGGKINGSFLAADLIDELSVMIVPVADGSIGTPTLFDVEGKRRAAPKLRLISVKRLESGMVWLRYKLRSRFARATSAS